MILNGVMAVNYFALFHRFRPLGLIKSKWLETDPLWEACCPANLVFGNTWFLVIFSEITEKERVKKRHTRFESENLTFATLRICLSNSRAFVWQYSELFCLTVSCFLKSKRKLKCYVFISWLFGLTLLLTLCNILQEFLTTVFAGSLRTTLWTGGNEPMSFWMRINSK